MGLIIGVEHEHRLALGDGVAFTYQTLNTRGRAHRVFLTSSSGAESPRGNADVECVHRLDVAVFGAHDFFATRCDGERGIGIATLRANQDRKSTRLNSSH